MKLPPDSNERFEGTDIQRSLADRRHDGISATSLMQSLILLLGIVIIYALTGCVETFQGDDRAPSAKLFGKARAVVGQRTVTGIEVPPVVLPVGFGVGVWIVRPAPVAIAPLPERK